MASGGQVLRRWLLFTKIADSSSFILSFDSSRPLEYLCIHYRQFSFWGKKRKKCTFGKKKLSKLYLCGSFRNVVLLSLFIIDLELESEDRELLD